MHIAYGMLLQTLFSFSPILVGLKLWEIFTSNNFIVDILNLHPSSGDSLLSQCAKDISPWKKGSGGPKISWLFLIHYELSENQKKILVFHSVLRWSRRCGLIQPPTRTQTTSRSPALLGLRIKKGIRFCSYLLSKQLSNLKLLV